LATNTKKKTTASSIAKALNAGKTVTSSGTKTTASGGTNYANTNYQADINDAVARGDYATAAKLEQQRNAKIDATGSSYAKTNNYSSYLNNGSSSSGGGSGSSYSPYTQYTPTGTYNDAGLSQWATSQINTYKQQYADAQAKGDEAGMNAAHQAAEAIRAKYGYSGGTDGSDYIKLPDKVFEYTEPQPTYESKYNPQMDALLNEILNREDFSYDVASDPLYQQYAQMYNREGDRVMRDTMAEAAAGAGGMNSYAMTAAMQAGNYYNSQLNDKIPELYQLAYDMYLADKESKVQDLGILQSLDETQYNRYRDTMSDWKDDRNFAYDMYRDNVADAQWNKTFDYNSFVNDRDFAYNSDWANKEWNYNVEQDALDREDEKKEDAKEEMWELIKLGIPPRADLLARAGYSDDDNKYNGGDGGHYATVSSDIASMVAQGDKGGATTYLQKMLNGGYITWPEYAAIIKKYGL